jgi:hypothetical protein
MPRQPNYGQLIPRNPQSAAVSRIAESDLDTDILQARVPAGFGFDYTDNLELHFYDSQNTLVNTTIIPVSTGIVVARSISLPGGSIEEKIVIDMARAQTELGLFLSPGSYTVTINLFSDEIGSYGNKKLTIEEISPSRTELRLGFNVQYTDTENSELFEFIEPSLPRVVAAGTIGSIIGHDEAQLITQENEPPQTQTQMFITDVNMELASLVPTIQSELSTIEPALPSELNTTISIAGAYVYEEFVKLLEITLTSKTFDRLQKNELDVLIEQAVANAFANNSIDVFIKGKIQLI